jgi:hypothetical protein
MLRLFWIAIALVLLGALVALTDRDGFYLWWKQVYDGGSINDPNNG